MSVTPPPSPVALQCRTPYREMWENLSQGNEALWSWYVLMVPDELILQKVRTRPDALSESQCLFALCRCSFSWLPGF